MKRLSICLALLISSSVMAKLPPPSDEAKLKALETKQKTAHADKTSAFQLCKSQDKVAERYRKGNKDAGAVVATPKCEDPGPFVFVPPEAAPAAPPATTAATAPAAAQGTPPSIAPGGATTGKSLPDSAQKPAPPATK